MQVAQDRAVPGEARKFARAIARNYRLLGRKGWLAEMTIRFERNQLTITDLTTINFRPTYVTGDRRPDTLFNRLRLKDDAPSRAIEYAKSLPLEQLIKAHVARHPRDLWESDSRSLALGSKNWLQDTPCHRCMGHGRHRCSFCGHKTERPATTILKGKKAVITEEEIVKELKPVTHFPYFTVEGTVYLPGGIPDVKVVKEKIKKTRYVPDYFIYYECYHCKDTRWATCAECEGKGSAIRAIHPGAFIRATYSRSVSGSAPDSLVSHADKTVALPPPSWQQASAASCAVRVTREISYWRVSLKKGAEELAPNGAYIGVGGQHFFQSCCDKLVSLVCDNRNLKGTSPLEWRLIAGLPANLGDAVSPALCIRLHGTAKRKQKFIIKWLLSFFFLAVCLIVIASSNSLLVR